MPLPTALAALGIAVAAAAGAAGAAEGRIDGAVERALSSAPAGGARAAAATRPLLGLPYRHSPLGEGAGPDPDPRFRLDAFDCWTFVETAIALGSSASLPEARRALDEIRYADHPSLAGRLHEVQGQWLPANLARGWVAELTRDLAGARARPLLRTHSAESWAAVRRAGRAIDGLARGHEPLGRFETWAVPPEDLVALGPAIPDGALVLVMREDQPRRATRVSHAGLVVVGPGGTRLVRHATSTAGVERVIEEDLPHYLRRERRAFPRWPLAGFALFALPDQSARVARLAHGEE